ncbi:MAG: hypothetical protein HOK21_03270 [Rhodospirillaceae bacterium]|jgi:hypothetical protein|nr:hypothetical protein [Rhodospirillaceae bacterium]MBT4044250.1 hypothetical protein [Rhodospirillaceae bacterium]MBT4689752.1 hypothetical protein [Rhodospirillaceae bacterium]MBT5083812.1 hypothetical protein [Rhodospirillaceae bacterium]MBT5523082.1 hypothetical protein [Rhodospirillaceae bacterium]
MTVSIQDRAPDISPDNPLPQSMSSAAIWGRRVMLAVLSLVVAIPVVNMRRLLTEGIPNGLENGDINIAYVIGMFFSVLLILVWYFAYVGKGKARVMLGAVYLITTSLTVVLPIALLFMGTELPPSWPISISLAAIYGLAGWVLLVSPNIKAFQQYQRQLRAAPA